jgi:hypothetical protein
MKCSGRQFGAPLVEKEFLAQLPPPTCVQMHVSLALDPADLAKECALGQQWIMQARLGVTKKLKVPRTLHFLQPWDWKHGIELFIFFVVYRRIVAHPSIRMRVQL